jgi:hypothetical protein
VQLGHIVPAQIAVRVIEDDDLRGPEDGAGVAELADANSAEIAIGNERRVADGSRLAARCADDDDAAPGVGQAGQRSAAGK